MSEHSSDNEDAQHSSREQRVLRRSNRLAADAAQQVDDAAAADNDTAAQIEASADARSTEQQQSRATTTAASRQSSAVDRQRRDRSTVAMSPVALDDAAAAQSALDSADAAAAAASAAAAAQQTAAAASSSSADELRRFMLTMSASQQQQQDSIAVLMTMMHLQQQQQQQQQHQQQQQQQQQTPVVRQQQNAAADEAYLERAPTVTLPESSGSKTIKPRMPEPFSGKADEVQSFVDAFDCVLAADKRMSQSERVAIVASYLTGGARVWYKTMRFRDPTAVNELSSWPRFSSAMLKHFGVEQADSVTYSKLMHIKQLTSANEYTVRFNDLLLKLEQRMPNRIAMHHYECGLKYTIQEKMAGNTYATLAEMQTAATKIDQVVFMIQQRIRSRSGKQDSTSTRVSQLDVDDETSKPTSNATTTTTTQLSKIVAEVVNSMKTTRPKRQAADQSDWSDNKKSRYSKGQCFTCGDAGHLARFCSRQRSSNE